MTKESSAAGGGRGNGTLLCVFGVQGAWYALDAANVQEVTRPDEITKVRGASEEVVGILNLRGKIVTVLDVSVILGGSPQEITPDSRMFVVDHEGEFEGLLAGQVRGVEEVDPDGLAPPPPNVPPEQAKFIEGVHHDAGDLFAVLSAPRVFAAGAR